MTASRALTGAAVVGGTVLAAPAVYLAGLSVAAAVHRPDSSQAADPRLRLAVLVPAHDEELLVGRCVDGLLAQDYPPDLFRVVVIADNCTDSTAEVARAHGAEVLVRRDRELQGKGHALRWAMTRLGAETPSVDAFVVVDADSVVDPGFLRALAAPAEAGAQAVQADYSALVEGEDDRAQLRAAAFLLFHRVRFSGKARLGLPCALVGNGMLFTRDLLEEHPWTAFSEVEDLEYTLNLREKRVRPVFAPAARVSAPVASAGRAAAVQRRRWEGGRARLTRHRLPRLALAVATGERLDLWDLVADLAVPPLGVLSASILVGTGVVTLLRLLGLVSDAAVVPWATAGVAVPTHVLVGFKAAESPPEMLAALRSAPSLVAEESRVRAALLRHRGAPGQWERTPRSSPARSTA